MIAALLAIGAFRFGRQRRPMVDRPTPRFRTVLLGGFLAATTVWGVPETWPGVAVAAGVLALGGGVLARAARASEWSGRHVVSLAAGALLSRALLALTYAPLIGDVSPTRKYLHNATLLAALVVVSSLAARRSAIDIRPVVAE